MQKLKKMMPKSVPARTTMPAQKLKSAPMKAVPKRVLPKKVVPAKRRYA